ncbi:hypothetical protein ACNJ7E_04535 [Rhodococcus sp. NM-2]
MKLDYCVVLENLTQRDKEILEMFVQYKDKFSEEHLLKYLQ